ncbi:MAG: hypothetical protein JWP58_1071 [Hymenobacter sp.]|nr:hypothetical protein [Hymenobacter sp.]
MDQTTPPLPTDRAAWPSHCARPEEILKWLNTLTSRDGLTAKCLLGMRWLVLAELERSVPEPEPKALPAFTPNLFGTPLTYEERPKHSH